MYNTSMKIKILLLILSSTLILANNNEYPRGSSKTHIDMVLHNALLYNKKVKYVWGGTSLKKGIDCSAFVQKIFSPFRKLPRTTNQQIKYSKAKQVPSVKWIKKGDLIYFKFEKNKPYKKVDHVGIYLGDGKFIHASSSLKGVSVSKLNNKWQKNIMRIIRIQI